MGRMVAPSRRSNSTVASESESKSGVVAEATPRRSVALSTFGKSTMAARDILIKISQTDDGRTRASTTSKWEPVIGYSRAVRAGNIIAVTGTLGINVDGTYPKTAAEQARRS